MLVPGIAMPRFTMCALQNRLEQDGYHVWNKGIISHTRPVAESAIALGRAISDCLKEDAKPVHFVTHSMGALLVRAYFQNNGTNDIGRAVMLGPPNRGSEMVDRIRDYWWYRLIYGPAGQEMSTSVFSTANQLGPIGLEVGVIAGLRDTRVSIAHAQLKEMRDFVAIDATHTALPYSREVYEQIVAFLRNGQFD